MSKNLIHDNIATSDKDVQSNLQIKNMQDGVLKIINHFFDSEWRGTYVVGGHIAQNSDEIKQKYDSYIHIIVTHISDETGKIRKFDFVPERLEIKNQNTDMGMMYQLCETHKAPHIHMFNVESATSDQLKKAGEFARKMRRGIQRPYSSMGRPKQALYDQAFLKILKDGFDRKAAFQWMNNQLELDETDTVSWDTFRRTIRRRQKDHDEKKRTKVWQ